MMRAAAMAALRQRLRSRKVLALLLVAVALAGVIIGLVASSNEHNYRTINAFVQGTPEPNGAKVRLDTTLYLPDKTPAPAVLLAQGFGGDKSDLASTASTLAKHGYVALAYTARGFGNSGGNIHFDSPKYEVHDAELLVDRLERNPDVLPNEIGVAGSSYGGGLALLLAAYDPGSIKAVAADITWNNLQSALFPNGVFKKLWTGELFGNGFGTPSVSDYLNDTSSTDASCGRFAKDVCAAYQASARTGRPTAALQTLMRQASPASVIDRITAPTLLTQGEQDSLFPLSQADANARGIAANGTPVRVVWRLGGHDEASAADNVATSQLLDWFGAVFGHQLAKRQPFQFAESGGVLSSESGQLTQQLRQADGYPGIGGVTRQTKTIRLSGPEHRIGAPAGGTPTAITAVPGLSSILAAFGAVSDATSALSAIPSQTAAFISPRVDSSLLIAGSSRITLDVTAQSTTNATLFLALRDLAPDGTVTLPAQLVTPIHVTGLRPGQPHQVTVQLPSVVRTVQPGHRLVLTVSTTDFAYQLPQNARTYTVALANGGTLAVPTIDATVLRSGHPLAWLLVGLAVVALAILGVAFELRRRRRVVKPRPELCDVPVNIDALTKEYAGGYRAVDDVSFRVDRGQVVGLLGPNGAGKTTTLRVLVGLIQPTSGTVHIFGEPVVPGAPVLARLGAFIEGPGFLPHLSGRENLRLYWAATGRPESEADFETALEIAGLGSSIDRRVKSYSHGMKQRLGIAQAMLGLPELLVLDEPTNGLDPPQIAEMREVMQRYAQTGRTVVVSSHLLAEVEQTCTHVVVMHKGKLVAAGSVFDIAGAGGTQLAVADPARAAAVLQEAGLTATLVPARRALEDVFLDLIGADE